MQGGAPILAGAAAVALALVATTAAAHHSPSMFQAERELTLAGTVREFQWTNPHCYIQLMVPNAAGEEEEWNLEMGAPLYLRNSGWSPSTLKAGDRISVTILPLRAGGRGGLVLGATDAHGSPIGRRP
jgi:hypothetical protein